MSTETTVRGGCHCGRVRFEAVVPAGATVHECNCSICRRLGYRHLIVSRARFRLLAGEDDLSEYTFNTGVARHFFCRRCGVKSFYVPRSNPDGVSVNHRCLDDDHGLDLPAEPFDGRNWEREAGRLRHLSRA